MGRRSKTAVAEHNNSDSDRKDHSGDHLQSSANNSAYWRANLRLSAVLLSIWFLVSFGFGILFVETLNEIQFFGFKLGFWWAQQGSIYVFIVLIFVYALAMKRLDRKYNVDDD
jgi:putative solute:sodium symporter small subunit